MSATDRRRVLETLYGASRAVELSGQVEARIAAATQVRRRDAGSLTAADAWLITYADQFQDGKRSPLQVLNQLLAAHIDPWITGVHVLPFYPWSSDDGFSVTDYSQVDPAYGDWDDIGALASDRRLMVDAVINHMSAESDWFRRFLAGDLEFADFFMTADPATDLTATVRPRTTPLLTEFDAADGKRWVWTTFSADQVDLDYRNPRVLLRVLDILLEYLHRGATAIRLDAVGFLWKVPGTTSSHLPQTHAVVHFIRLVLDAVAPGTVLITETNVPHEENISYFGTVAQPEAQLVYQFPLAPLVLDAFATGNATALAAWADSLATPYPGTSFLNFLASHDGIGVRPAEGLVPDTRIRDLAAMSRRAGGGVGERTLADGTIVPYELNSTWFDLMAAGYGESEAISRHLSSHAVMFAMAGVPLIYVHSLFGSSNDAEGFAKTGRPRSYNREKFTDLARLMSKLEDGSSRAGRIFAGMREMATTRSRIAAFDPFAPQAILAAQPELLVVLRGEGSERALVVVNVSADTVEYQLPDGPWRSLLGPEPGSAGWIALPPWEAAWLATRSQ